MSRDKQNIKTTDWLTRGMTEEEIAREKEKAIKEAEAELRNKQIEEMVREIDKWYPTAKITNDFIAKMLYNAGYRKSSDLAEEIFAEIENINAHGDGYYEYWKDWLAKLAELKKKYIGKDTNAPTKESEKDNE